MITWKRLVRQFLQSVKEPINEVDKNAFAVVFTNSHCTEEVVGHVQQGNASTTNKDWKSF